MDNDVQHCIDIIVNRALCYFYEEIKTRDLSGKAHMWVCSAYPDDKYATVNEPYRRIVTKESPSVIFNSAMCTITSPTVIDDIVTDVISNVYLTYQSIYETFINTRLNAWTAIDSINFQTRHEIGHVVCDQSLIGKTVDEWNNNSAGQDAAYESLPKLRRNASYDSRLKWYLMYNQLPIEKMANEIMGITEEDIIEDYKRLHRKKGK